jgi:hypothetical protein
VPWRENIFVPAGKAQNVRCKQLLWVSLLHPTVSGHRIDYPLGNLESKFIWTQPK